MYHVAHLSENEIKTAVLRFVQDQSSEYTEGSKVQLNVQTGEPNATFVITAEVTAPNTDED